MSLEDVFFLVLVVFMVLAFGIHLYLSYGWWQLQKQLKKSIDENFGDGG